MRPGTPDVIVTQLPYQSQESRSAMTVLDRLGDISARLRPDATAVVIGPADVLVGALPPTRTPSGPARSCSRSTWSRR